MSEPLESKVFAETMSPTASRAEGIVDHVHYFLLVLIGALVLLRIPRAFARLWKPSEWLAGHFLHHKRKRRTTSVIVQAYHNVYPPPSTLDLASDDSHTLYSHQKSFDRIDEKGQPLAVSYPPHVPEVPTFIHRFLLPLKYSIYPGYNIAQSIVMACYFSTLIYASFYRSSPFTDPVRTGWVAVAQMPFAVAFATKNNLFGWLLGAGYSKLNYIHRFAGRLLVIAANVHSLGYIYKWTLQGDFTKHVRATAAKWGFVALVAMDCMYFFSTSFWRKNAYPVFLVVHIVSFGPALAGLWIHQPGITPYVLACIAVYALDYVFRVLKTRFACATIRPLPELGYTRVEIPSINSGWRAGQHVRLRVVSFGMGWWGWTEVHPFTIASISGSSEGLVLMCKKTGPWTDKLYEMAKASGYTEGGFGRSVYVTVEGPYGGPGHAMFASFSGAVFVVGGSGITYALSAIQDLVRKDLKGQCRVKHMDLVWVVPDRAALQPLIPQFTSMIAQSIFMPIRISVHYTRASEVSSKDAFQGFPGLTLTAGRPRIAKVLDAAISRAVSLGSGPKDQERITGLLVAVCGPRGLGEDVAKAISTVDPARRNQVGGIELHEEVFGW